MANPPNSSGFLPPPMGAMGSVPPPAFAPPPASSDDLPPPPPPTFGDDGEDAYWDPSQLDNDTIAPPIAPPPLGGGSFIPPPMGPPPGIGSSTIPPPSSNPVGPPPPFMPPPGISPPPLTGSGISIPPPVQGSAMSVPPPAAGGIMPPGGPGSMNMDAVREHQKMQEILRQQYQQQGSSFVPLIFIPGVTGAPNVILPQAAAPAPKPAVKEPAPAVDVKLEEHPIPKTWTDFVENDEFGRALTGVEEEDKIRAKREKVAGATSLKILVCGTATSNKSVWLANFLGLLCVRQPSSDVMHARFKADDQMYLLEFAETDQMSVSAEYMYKWADAFVLVYDVESRDSFENVKDMYRSITEERGTVYIPIVLVANHTAAREDTWKVPRPEAVTLSDTLNIPFCTCSTPEEAHKSVHTLIEEVRKKDKKRAEGVGADSSSMQHKEINEFEIVLLGDAFVGKTTFMNRVFDHKFESSYVSTTSKIIRKDQIVINGERCMIKIVDTPWFPPAPQATAMESGSGNPKGVMSASAMATVEWLKQQQLLQAQSFFILFSVTNRDSYILAQELISQLQSALLYAPKSANKVIFLIGTKTDQVYSTVISSLDVFQTAQRLGVLSTTMSLNDESPEALQLVFERLMAGLRQGEIKFKENFELEKQGYLTVTRGRDRKKGKQKQYFCIHDGQILVSHSEKDIGSICRMPISETSKIESFRGDKDPKDALILHYITGDQSQELWIAASNMAERDSWELCLQQNIVAAQAAYSVTESFVQRELFRLLREIAPGVSADEFAPVNRALMKEHFSLPGHSLMCVTPVEQAPKVSAKEAKKLEKEQEKEKRKMEKEREKAEKEREKAEKEREKAEKKKK